MILFENFIKKIEERGFNSRYVFFSCLIVSLSSFETR